MRIEDGKGKNGDMSVSTSQRGNVSAKTRDRSFYANRDDAKAFVAVYDDITAASGDHIAYLKNTSKTDNLMINRIEAASVEIAKFKVWGCTGTAASGDLISSSQLNRSSKLSADATVMTGDTAITGLTVDDALGIMRTEANGESKEDYDGVVLLGPGDAIVIEYDTGTTGACTVSIFFWYETVGAK